MTRLELADGLRLPLDAATQTFLVVGKRGSGKSSTATRLAEQLVRAGVPIAVLDPVDVWWGLKAGADGKREGGLEVYVFGGEHADGGIALESTAGALMADVLVDHRINAVFVLRAFSNREKARFVADFAEQLFKRNRDVLHLFCEEAHELMPQQPYGGEEEMLGRMLRLQKLGRTSGIGLSSITQRPASLNKNATTQAEVLVAHRIIGPQDRSAIEEWIKHHHVAEQKAEVLETLPTLKTGEAWIWAPDFPEDRPIGLRRVLIARPETFDSRRTPKPGQRRVQPKALAPVDLDKLGERMRASRERADANDPAKLRSEVARLRGELAKRAPTAAAPKRVEVPVFKDGQLKRLEKTADKLVDVGSALANLAGITSEIGRQILTAISRPAPSAGRVEIPDGAGRVRAAAAPAANRPSRVPKPADVGGREGNVRSGERPRVADGISKAQQRLLDSLAWLGSVGVHDVRREALAALSRVSPTSGSYSVNVNRLREAGLIEYPQAGHVRVTSAGLAAANAPSAPLTVADLHAALYEKLPRAQGEILRELVAIYPNAVARAELAERLGVSATSGSYSVNIGDLHDYGFVSYPRPGQVAATPILFLESVA